jgi:formamidopyrimidine-DNA glycosylase
MPELPDVVILARSMDQALANRTIVGATVNQPRCLNLPAEEFVQAVAGRAFQRVGQRGKWVLAHLDGGGILAFSLGMGGELRLHGPEEVPDPKRERVVLHLDDSSGLWAHFWWFGHVHWLPQGDLGPHPQIGRLGPEPLADDFTPRRLAEMLRGRRGAIKRYLLWYRTQSATAVPGRSHTARRPPFPLLRRTAAPARPADPQAAGGSQSRR